MRAGTGITQSQAAAGGGGGGSVNTVTASTPLASSGGANPDISIPQADTSTDGFLSQTDWNTFNNKQVAQVGNASTFAGFDGSKNLFSIPGFLIDGFAGGFNLNQNVQPNNNGSGTVHQFYTQFNPLQDSPNDTFNGLNYEFDIDPNSLGFAMGTSGNFGNILNLNVRHKGTSNTGSFQFMSAYADIGNGTDPITINGFSYFPGYGDIQSGVTVANQIQGFMFQPNAHAGAIFQNQVTAFGDQANFSPVDMPGWVSANFSPQIGGILTNTNYNGVNISPNITTFHGNAGYFGLNMFPVITSFSTGFLAYLNLSGNIGTMQNGNFINLNPNVTSVTGFVNGVSIDMQNVTVYAGAHSSLTVQDLHFVMNQAGDNNNLTIEYVNDGIAGSETCTFVFPAITVHIQSGVSTATQVLAAITANFTVASNITTTITGVGSNPQVTTGPTNFAGGINPGNKRAGYFRGDVQIDGALSFTGALSVGQINAFANFTPVSGAGVTSIDSLITGINVAASATITGTDILAINTASLMNIGAGATVTTSFLGYAALGLPAVLTMGAGATIDLVSGATFAISLDSSAGGGVADKVYLCRALAIPNGVTTVNNIYGYGMDMPFGDVGTNKWGVWISPNINNWLKGSLKIGGTAGVSDQPTNSSVGLELDSTTKVFLNARMTTAQKTALTALNGMQVYDTDLDKLQVYAAGAWVNLH